MDRQNLQVHTNEEWSALVHALGMGFELLDIICMKAMHDNAVSTGPSKQLCHLLMFVAETHALLAECITTDQVDLRTAIARFRLSADATRPVEKWVAEALDLTLEELGTIGSGKDC